MGLYKVPLSMSLLGFVMGTMLGSLHMCGIMLVLRAEVTSFLSPSPPPARVEFTPPSTKKR